MSSTSNGEGGIGKLRKVAMTIWLFSGLFGVIILMSSSTTTGLYLGLFFLFVSFTVLVIWAMWNIASKADELVGRYAGYTPEIGVKVHEHSLPNLVHSNTVNDNNEVKQDEPIGRGKLLAGGIIIAIILYWMTII